MVFRTAAHIAKRELNNKLVNEKIESVILISPVTFEIDCPS